MSEWKRYKLGELLRVKHGWAFKGEFFSDTGIQSILTPGNFYESGGFKANPSKDRFYCGDYPKEYLCSKGDLIVAMTEQAAGLLGSTAIVPEDNRYLHNQRIGLISCNESLNKDFAYYLFMTQSVRQQISRSASGTKVKHTSPEKIYDVQVDIPKIQTQKNIAIFLSSLDKKIQINNQIHQELEAMAKTLYDYWFVQFDFPDQNGKPYKSSGGKMVYNPELKREIPEGWGVTTFSSWISDNKTGDWGKETSEGNYKLEVDCIRGADINGLSGNGKIDMPTRFILEKNKNKLLTEFDIVIEISGGSPTQSTGRIVGISENVLNRFELPLICSNFCKAVSLNEQETFYNFVYEWKNLYDNGVLFSWEGKTSGIKNLLFDSFVTNYHIAQPPIGLMEQFFDYASSVDRKIQLLLKQNQELTQLRDWLLPMLMNGQVKVE
ncbi:restriction endonuclease subunit S [Streptococcus sp. LPB0406]|nr:restriction endonuclease subunit S [Streptococcus sp. LPB0406]